MFLRKFIALAIGVGLFFGAAVTDSRAADQPYLEQAISETGEAITAGKAQESASMIEHADRAFDRARSAVWRNPIDHIRQGIKFLRKAVKVAKGTSSPARITKALGFLETAKTHFEAAR
jgi:hypothetical protein